MYVIGNENESEDALTKRGRSDKDGRSDKEKPKTRVCLVQPFMVREIVQNSFLFNAVKLFTNISIHIYIQEVCTSFSNSYGCNFYLFVCFLIKGFSIALVWSHAPITACSR